MIMVCHNLNPKIPSDVAFAESRVRPETQAAENILHDLGVISMISSDSQAMGRVGENFLRAFQMASYMKQVRGKLAEDSADNDNFRVLRYLAKLTITPALTYGFSEVLGSVEKGKMADLGDPNASLPTPQPVYYRPMYGSFGSAMPKSCISFVSRASHDAGIKEKYGLQRIVYPVHGCRQIGKPHMVLNGNMPKIDVNPETFEVFIDGRQAYVKPAQKFSLAQLYWFS